MTRIVDIEWKKAESESVFYKNYKTWGWSSTSPKLYIKFQKFNGTIIEKDVYNFIIKKLGWKKLSEKRVDELKKIFLGKVVNHEVFVAN